MAHNSDYWETIRQTIIPPLGYITQLLEDITGADLYVESETGMEQYVGCVPMCEEQFERELTRMGFKRNPLASLKHKANNPKESEEGSFRKIAVSGIEEMQLHVVLYDGKIKTDAPVRKTYVYAHQEYRWDTNPIKHYRGKCYNAEAGVANMRQLLHQYGVAYDPSQPRFID